MSEPARSRPAAPSNSCSTPFGILYVGTCGVCVGVLTNLRMCSTPFGILYVGTQTAQGPRADAGVLNAFRHLICRNSRQVSGWFCWGFSCSLQGLLSADRRRVKPSKILPAPVLQVPDISVVFWLSGIRSSSVSAFSQEIQAVRCSSDAVTPNIPRCMILEIFRMSHDTKTWLLRGPLDPGIPRNQFRRA